MNTKIIAFAGKKQSGKNTALNFVHAVCFVFDPMKLTQKSYIDEQGGLVVETTDGDGVFDLSRRDPEFVEFASSHIWPFIRKYSFAEPLKTMCVDILGVPEAQAFGTDEEKNQPVPHLLWESFPLKAWRHQNGHVVVDQNVNPVAAKLLPATGPMTGREVLQYWGTEIFRKSYSNVWADACVRKIEKEQPAIGAIIDDTRFPNEVQAVHAAGGKVIRLTRNPLDDKHDSETALDEDKYDWHKFDAIIPNHTMTINECNNEIFKLLIEWGWIKEEA